MTIKQAVDAGAEANARQNFAVIETLVQTIEWLQLKDADQRRAIVHACTGWAGLSRRSRPDRGGRVCRPRCAAWSVLFGAREKGDEAMTTGATMPRFKEPDRVPDG